MINRYFLLVFIMMFSILTPCQELMTYTVKTEGLSQDLVLKIFNSKNQFVDQYTPVPGNLTLSYEPDTYNCFIYSEGKEIFNFTLDEEIYIHHFKIDNIRLKNISGEGRSYLLNGMFKRLKTRKDIIPGPILYIGSPQINIFDTSGAVVHSQLLGDVSKEYNVIYEGKAKVRVRVKWDAAEDKEIYILHTINSRTPKLEKMLKKEHYFQFFATLDSLPFENDFDHWYQIICENKSSAKFPVINYTTNDYDFNHDFDSFMNRPLYQFHLKFYMLPINKWDRIFIKHNLFDFPDNINGYDRSVMELTDKRRMTYEFEVHSREGLKFYEIWAEDIETGELKKLYADKTMLDRSTLIEYDFDNKHEKTVIEKILPYLLVLILLFMLYPVVKRKISVLFKEMPEKTLYIQVNSMVKKNNEIFIGKYDESLWVLLKNSVDSLYSNNNNQDDHLNYIENNIESIFFKDNVLLHLKDIDIETLDKYRNFSEKEEVNFFLLYDNRDDEIKDNVTMEINEEDVGKYTLKFSEEKIIFYKKDDKVLKWDKADNQKNT